MLKHNDSRMGVEEEFLSFCPELFIALADSPHASDIRNQTEQQIPVSREC